MRASRWYRPRKTWPKRRASRRRSCDAVTVRRYEQYQEALANDRAFQKRYMFPAEVSLGKKKTALIETDEGITPTTAEGLAKLKPAEPGGVISFGAQTHPADGNCGFIIATRDKAKALSADPKTEIQILSYGFSRVKRGYMAAAPVPATEMALKIADLKIGDMEGHQNPQSLHRQRHQYGQKDGRRCDEDEQLRVFFGIRASAGPTAGRLIAEMIEEIVILAAVTAYGPAAQLGYGCSPHRESRVRISSAILS